MGCGKCGVERRCGVGASIAISREVGCAVPSGDAAAQMPLEIEPPVRLAAYRTSLTTWVNGTKHEIAAADLNMTLLEWLRASMPAR